MHTIFKMIQIEGVLLFENLILQELLFFIENVAFFNLLEKRHGFFRGFYIYWHGVDKESLSFGLSGILLSKFELS